MNIRITTAIMSALAVAGVSIGPVGSMPAIRQPTPEEQEFLDSLTAETRFMWLRRIRRGLSPSEREFVRARAAELKTEA